MTGAVAALSVAMVSFQVGSSVAKHLIPIVGAPGATALRLAISALIVGVAQRPWRSVPSAAALRAIVPYGLALGTMNFVFYQALSRIPLGIAVGLEFTGPLAVALLGSRRRLDLLWVACAIAGLALLLPYTLEMIALRRLSPRAFGTLMSLEPALAAAAGFVLLGERLSGVQWSGIAAVIVASVGTLGNEAGVAEVTDAAADR